MHEKGETFSKYAIHKEFEQIGTSYAASFSQDEQTMLANPLLVYHGFW